MKLFLCALPPVYLDRGSVPQVSCTNRIDVENISGGSRKACHVENKSCPFIRYYTLKPPVLAVVTQDETVIESDQIQLTQGL